MWLGQFQEEITLGNEGSKLSGADLVAQKKIQVEEKGLSRFWNLWGICLQNIDMIWWDDLTLIAFQEGCLPDKIWKMDTGPMWSSKDIQERT